MGEVIRYLFLMAFVLVCIAIMEINTPGDINNSGGVNRNEVVGIFIPDIRF